MTSKATVWIDTVAPQAVVLQAFVRTRADPETLGHSEFIRYGHR